MPSWPNVLAASSAPASALAFRLFIFLKNFVGIQLQVPWAAFTTPFAIRRRSLGFGPWSLKTTRAHSHTHTLTHSPRLKFFFKMDIWPLAHTYPGPYLTPSPLFHPPPPHPSPKNCSAPTHIYQDAYPHLYLLPVSVCVCVGFKTLNNFGNGLRIDCKLGN